MNTQHKLLSSCPVSCFADEIAESLDRQIEVLSRLGISYIELRSADGINVSDFTMDFAKKVKQKLDQANIHVSALYPHVQLLYPGKPRCSRLPLRSAFPDGDNGCRGCA